MAKEAWHPQADTPPNSEFVCSIDVKVHCHTSSMKSSKEIDMEELHTCFDMCIRMYVSTTQCRVAIYAILLRVAEILHAAL